jgi:PAS domain S-box-containing protein
VPFTAANRKSSARRANTPHDIVFERAPFVGLVVRRGDERILDVNREWELATGIPRATAVGKTLADLGFATEDGEAWESVLRATEANGLRDRRVRLTMPSGEVRTAAVNADPILWRRERCVMVSARDLTTGEGTSEALARTERRLELATSVRQTALWEWDLSTDRVWFSEECKRTLGYAGEELDDQRTEWKARCHPDDLPLLVTRTEAYLADPRGELTHEYRIRHRDGSWRWIHSRAIGILDHDGKVERLVGSHLDLTETRQAQARVTELNRSLAMRSGVNRLIVHEQRAGALLQGTCEIAVREGGFALAFACRVASPGTCHRLDAFAGGSDEARAQVEEVLRNGECGTAAAEMASGREDLRRELAGPTGACPWHDVAQPLGLQRLVHFPLRVRGTTFGVLYLFDRDQHHRSDAEIGTLREIAADVAFGLEVARREGDRQRTEGRIARQQASLLALLALPTTLEVDHAAQTRRITEEAARTLGVGRVSVWERAEDGSEIRCHDLFDLRTGEHASGEVFPRTKAPQYFEALESHDVIAADDALADPRTSEFAAGYLRPLDIRSMLDAPIQARDSLAGVLCVEAVGESRQWTADERTFVISLASLVSLSLERERRRLADRAAAQRAEILEKVFDNVPVMLTFTDPDGRIQVANRETERVLGWSSDELRSHADIFGAMFPGPGARERAMEFVRAGAGDFFEFRARRRDGTPVIATFASVLLSDGMSVGIGIDESERLQQQVALRESESRFREIAESIQEVFWVTEPASGKALYVSPAYETIWGRSSAEFLTDPLSWLRSIHADDRERIHAAFLEGMRLGQYDEAYRIVRPDGTERWIRDRAFPVRDHDGRITKLVGVARDVTEIRSLGEQLRQSQKLEAIGLLAGGIAHDFNNVLAAILMQAELAGMHDDLPPGLPEELELIRESAERAANLTRQLLLFSRRQVMRTSDVDLNAVVTNLGKMLRRIIGEDVLLQLQPWSVALPVNADAGMLDQLLLNLSVNARDAMPDGGTVRIVTDRVASPEVDRTRPAGLGPGVYGRILVSDTGTGIAPEILSRIFDPFFTTKEAGKGTGLGLATVFGIVQQHRGAIQVESTVGAGTTFTAWFPLSATAALGPPGTATAAGLPRGTERILLAEDDVAVRTITRRTLERFGYRVTEARDGRDAIRRWSEPGAAFDLLLTDVTMPGGMNGRDLATRLQREQPRLRVLFTSGYSAAASGTAVDLSDVENYVPKPCTPRDLLVAVRIALDGAPAAEGPRAG